MAPLHHLHAKAAAKRYERRLNTAFIAVQDGQDIRTAAEIARMSLSRFWYKYHHREDDRMYSRTDLTADEEQRIVEVLQRHSRKGKFMRMADLQDAVQMLVKTFPEERQDKLRFIDGRSGRKFCKAFECRHAHEVSFRKPSKKEAKHYLATSTVVLTQHFAQMERVIIENNIDSQRIINVDESGVTVSKDTIKSAKTKVYCTRSTRPEPRDAKFSKVNRVTLLGCIHASGDICRPMFVLQDTGLRYRLLKDGFNHETTEETIADCLPRNALLATKQDVAGVHKHNFIAWARALVEELKDLLANNRKVLLLYDGYRSHLTIEVLEIFHKAGIIAYALHSHTSGTTQPLNRTVFGPWKLFLREYLSSVTAARKKTDPPLNEFGICHLTTRAYRKAFTAENATAGFRCTGIHRLDEIKLFGKPRPLDEDNPETIVDVEEMCRMLDDKQKLRSNELLDAKTVMLNRFIDNSKGSVLTREKAMELLRDELAVKTAKQKLKYEEEEAKRLLQQEQYFAKKQKRIENITAAMHFRHRDYGDPLVLPRSIRRRRQAAKLRMKRKCDVVGQVSATMLGMGNDGGTLGAESTSRHCFEDSVDQWDEQAPSKSIVVSEGSEVMMEMSEPYEML